MANSEQVVHADYDKLKKKTGLALTLSGVSVFLWFVSVCPFFFTSWETGGYEPGNCFKHSADPSIYARIDSIGARDINYFTIDTADNSFLYKSRPNDSLSEGFRTVYKEQILCSEFDKMTTTIKLKQLEERVKELETRGQTK